MEDADNNSWPAPGHPLSPEESLVEAALGLPPTERPAFLEKACGGDAPLRRLVEALLCAHDLAVRNHARGRAEAPAPSTVTADPPTEKSGHQIGRYKLLQEIGSGGCGIVYMADQEEPVKRRVALKVIKLGMDTREVIARFQAERQALALMDHPNIATVLDGGVTTAGRPYFVMELVGGSSSSAHRLI